MKKYIIIIVFSLIIMVTLGIVLSFGIKTTKNETKTKIQTTTENQQVVKQDEDPIYLEGYGVTKDYVCIKPDNKLQSLPGEDTPLSPTHRRYLPGDVVPQGVVCDVDYDQRIVNLYFYEKSYADLAGAVKKYHIPLPQKVTVKVWYAEGLPYMRVPHKFPATMDEFKGRPCRRWIAVQCISTFNGCYSANIFEISDGDSNFNKLEPGSDEFVAMCYKYSHSVDANINQSIYRRYKFIDRDRDFYFHYYKIDSDGLWITRGAHKFPGVRDKSSWRTSQKHFNLWRLREAEDF